MFGFGQQLVAQPRASLTISDDFRSEHQRWEINLQFMERNIRTLRHEAKVTRVAVVDDISVFLPANAV